jgi:hypothetical protein
MKLKSTVLGMGILMILSSCATYQYARSVKFISFEDEAKKGKSVGYLRGEDCAWSLFGTQLGRGPSLDEAFASARSGRNGHTIVREFASRDNRSTPNTIRYLNNVSTSNEGFQAWIVGKQCVVVKGVAYK